MNRRSAILTALVFVIAGCFSVVRADSWALPTKKKFYAPNKQYYLEVTPKKLESQLQYFRDKSDGKENAGAARDEKENRARGAFYAREDGGGYSRRWEIALTNEVAPVDVLVSDDGSYVVTFDNWHSVGYGDNVVVIYNSHGALVKKFGLADLLTEDDIETLPHTVSSIWWGGKHYIDERSGHLVLKVVSNGELSSRRSDATFHDLKIDLATGRPLEPKRDLFPQRAFSIASSAQPTASSAVATDSPRCASPEASFDSTDAVRLLPAQIYVHVKARPFPPYPPIARASHTTGTVVVEILVSKAGDVMCARSMSGHPLLRQAAVAAALNWKFEPFKASAHPATAVGTIAFEFKMDVKEMSSNNQPRD